MRGGESLKITELFKRNNKDQKAVTVSSYKMMTEDNNSLFVWNDNLYDSDIVRSVIRVKAKAVAKSTAKHIRNDTKKGLQVNPDAYMRFLLEEPNPLMSMQQLLEKMVTQLELNNNAFAYIQRDEMGYPTGLYPITTTNIDVLKNNLGELYLRFTVANGKQVTFKYTDIIHLRNDFNSNEIFGDSNIESLRGLMDVVGNVDKSVISAIKNSNMVSWLLKYNANLSPDDLKASTKQFVDSFLSQDSDVVGAAAVDNKMEAQQVNQQSYVPNEKQMDLTKQRIYSYFNINENIIQSKYSENEWIAFYESAIEPIIVQLSNEFTRKLFTRKERSFGSKIVFEASNLSFASMQTKLGLYAYVNIGVLSPNEVRQILNMHPVPHGDEYLLRLDTAKQSEQVREVN